MDFQKVSFNKKIQYKVKISHLKSNNISISKFKLLKNTPKKKTILNSLT